MAKLILSQEEVEKLYYEVKRHPSLLLKLSDYQKSKILSFAYSKQLEAMAELEKAQIKAGDKVGRIGSPEQYDHWLNYIGLQDDSSIVIKAINNYAEAKKQKYKMNNTFCDFRHLTDLKVHSQAIEKLNKGQHRLQVLPFVPNCEVAINAHEFLNSEFNNDDRWYNIRRGYEKVFLDVKGVIERDLGELVDNDIKRVAYLKRIYRELHIKPLKVSPFLSLEASVAYFKSAEFMKLSSTLEKKLREDLNEVGYVLNLCNIYRQAIDSLIEEEFIVEGIFGNLPHKRIKTEQKTTAISTDYNMLQSVKQENDIDDCVNRIIAKFRDKHHDLLSQEKDDVIHAPFQIVWQGSVEKKKEVETIIRRSLVNSLNEAWSASELWIKEFRQEAIQQPHDINNIFEKYISYYRDLVEQYKSFKRWALEYWPEPIQPDSKHLLDGLWKELFDFWSSNNLEMIIGLEIVERVFAANLTVAKLSRERVSQTIHEHEVNDLIFNPINVKSKEINASTSNEQQEESKNNDENDIINSFADLFFQSGDIDYCVDALYRIRPDKPIISNTRPRCWQKRKGSKAILSAWIRRMEDVDKIKFMVMS